MPTTLHTFTLRPAMPVRQPTAQRAQRYTPKSLTEQQWQWARQAVIDAVVGSGATDAQAVARLGALCAFLAGTSAWDRRSVPQLAAIVTERNVRAWMAAAGTSTARTQGVSQLLPVVRYLAGAQPHLRLSREADVSLTGAAGLPVSFVELNAALAQVVGYQVDGPAWQVGTASWQRTSTVLGADVISMLAERTSQEPSMPALTKGAAPVTTPADRPARSSKPMSKAARVRAAKDARARKAALARAGLTRPVEEFGNSPEVLEAIEKYRPTQDALWDEVRPLACYLMAAYQAPSARRVQSVASAVTSFVLWFATSTYRADRSVPVTLSELQRIDVADAYIVTRTDLSENSRGTHRSIIRRVLRRADNAPNADTLQKQPIVAPYTPAECRTLVEVAAAQPTVQRSRQALWLVALGLGAGLNAGDFRHLRRSDITTVTIDGGEALVVTVPGAKPRAVPVMSEFAPAVRAAMALHDEVLGADALVLNGLEGRKQVLRTTLRRLETTTGEMVINQGRLRATWLFAAIHAPIPLTVLLDVAGLASARSLTELAQYSPAREATSAETLALVKQEVAR
ncbi:hypothetical protein [Janibacter anophelis]|uniref:hypothetical protein n=1 Tax=Janibacter anophelis TaxID=319054 RepID=UPI00082AC324|nr:hypothetical protein [Janibacter anophelis]